MMETRKNNVSYVIRGIIVAGILSAGLLMSQTGKGARTLSLSEVSKVNAGDSVQYVNEILGEAPNQLSGFCVDIYILEDGKQAIIYYDDEGLVESVRIRDGRLDSTYLL